MLNQQYKMSKVWNYFEQLLLMLSVKQTKYIEIMLKVVKGFNTILRLLYISSVFSLLLEGDIGGLLFSETWCGIHQWCLVMNHRLKHTSRRLTYLSFLLHSVASWTRIYIMILNLHLGVFTRGTLVDVWQEWTLGPPRRLKFCPNPTLPFSSDPQMSFSLWPIPPHSFLF